MRIPKPFLPVAVETDDLSYRARVLGREMTFGANSLVKSIKSNGKELLSERMRFVGTEDGEPIIWDTIMKITKADVLFNQEKTIRLCFAAQ